jgi:hypothetical protein
MALPITVGMYGALYQYLRTGEAPKEIKDYFYPKTGESTPTAIRSACKCRAT